MTIRVIRAGEHIQHIGLGISVRESGVAVAGAKWWEVSGKTCVGAYQAKGVSSDAAARVNLANPGTNNLTDNGNAPSWSSAGWAATGVNKYLITGLYPTGNWTIIIQFRDVGNGALMGVATFGMRIAVLPTNGTQRTYYYAGGGLNVTNGAVSAGNMAIAGGAYYYNGLLDGSQSGTFTGTNPAYIGSAYGGSGAPTYTIIAAALYSDALTAAQVATLAAAMAAL